MPNALGDIAPIISTRYVNSSGILFQADCLDLLANIRTGSIGLAFVDPPFNLGKKYEDPSLSDKHQDEAYRSWCRAWLIEVIRVLRPGGSLFIYHWPKWLMDLGSWLNFSTEVEYRSWIAMKMKAGFPIPGRVHPAHYGLLHYSKVGKAATFNTVRCKSPTCRFCGKLIRDYGGYRTKYKQFEDEDGVPWIQVSDFWEDTRPATWDKVRGLKINELPIQVPERAILMASNPGDVVLDCFAGAGSTLHAAQRNGRFWIGGDFGDSTASLRRFASICGKREFHTLRREIRACFKPQFNKILPNYEDSKHPPIRLAQELPGFCEAFERTLPKSRVFSSSNRRGKQPSL